MFLLILKSIRIKSFDLNNFKQGEYNKYNIYNNECFLIFKIYLSMYMIDDNNRWKLQITFAITQNLYCHIYLNMNLMLMLFCWKFIRFRTFKNISKSYKYSNITPILFNFWLQMYIMLFNILIKFQIF